MSAENIVHSDDENDVYLDIRPEGEITGVKWTKGKWVHVGSKRRLVDVPTNPKKRAKLSMKVEQAEINSLSIAVKQNRPPKNFPPLGLLKATELLEKYGAKSSETNEIEVNVNEAILSRCPEGTREALDYLLSHDYRVPNRFSDLKISQFSKHALKKKGFTFMTDIQKVAIPHALCGRDVLGSAQTGSGKTLAFVIPCIEVLYRKSWNRDLGLGALVLSPTRELALQNFHMIRLVGFRHRYLPIGLCIGGNPKNVEEEKRTVSKMSILVGTPGRVLSHLESAPHFHVNHLQMVVIDEADMMLEIGLSDQVQQILGHLPYKKQTLLFSATLTCDVVKMSHLALRKPVFVPMNEKGISQPGRTLPIELVQTYVEVPLEDKFNLLWSFIQTHVDNKIIIFFATLRQVKFTQKMLVGLRPFSAICHLQSEMSQYKRIEMYNKFRRLTSRCILLCTEVGSRGLDFANVDFVINFDVPADVDSYIHRVGRSARIGQRGNCVTFVSENELLFIDELKQNGISLKKLGVKMDKLESVLPRMRTILAQDGRMMELAEKAFCAYLAFYYFHGNDNYMDGRRLNKDKLAYSFGLMHTPPYNKFLKRLKAKRLVDMPSDLKHLLLDTAKKREQKKKLVQLREEREEKEEEDERRMANAPKEEVDDEDVQDWLESEDEDDDEDGVTESKRVTPVDIDEDSDEDVDVDLEESALSAILGRFG